MSELLVFGAGFSALECAARTREMFERRIGTTRSAAKEEKLRGAGLEPLLFDGAPTPQLREALARASHLLVSIAPGHSGDPVLSAFHAELLAAPALQWIGYLSTVGVYGDHGGAWITEEALPRPVSPRSVERFAAEEAWKSLARQKRIPLAILRLSGIYGPGRNAFVNLEKGTARRLVKPDQVFNRIHRDDIARAFELAARGKAAGVYNITDDEPSPPQDVIAFAAGLMGVEPPPEQDFATAELTPMARSFYGENKRVSNAKSKAALGMEYAWPDYRTALTRMWEEGSWR